MRSAELELERAQIHADRARRQFDACEPENRLVARTLEREWEQRLTAVRRAERALAEVAARRPDPLTDEEIAWCRQAGADLREVFDAPTTSDRERKQLLRAILTEVVVTVDRDSERHAAELRVVWEGGAVTEHNVPLRAPAATPAAPTRTRSRSCASSPSATPTSRSPRSSPAKDGAPAPATRSPPTASPGCAPTTRSPPLPSDQPLTMATMVTIAKAASELGVSTATVHRWLREGFITGEQITPGAPWQIRLTDELRAARLRARPRRLAAAHRRRPALGVARQTVLHKVQRGELAAVYVHRGKRKGLRIQVKPDQAGLFENDIREEKQC